ncbi:MAG: hypothetical protein IMZ46_13310 [Acidobacteria bacterium]|nr:hypothetical protein [Acidobacteriota bacterium]
MTKAPLRPSYTILPVDAEFVPGAADAPWAAIPSLQIDHYLWLGNGYRPPVEVKLCYSRSSLHVRFRVGERRVRVKYVKFQDPVYKDSCVEFFIDAFPESRQGYVNFETNAAGTLLAAFGPDRNNRKPLWPEDLSGFDVVSSIGGPCDGEHGGDIWTLEYKVPLALFLKIYGQEVLPGHRATANFYKCGDETEVPHYGAWNPVDTPSPDFHRPEFFGEIVFGR